MPLDRTQISAFIDAMIGSTPIGTDPDHEVVEVPTSPLVRAFVVARLGDQTLTSAYDACLTRSQGRREAFAGLLRAVADGIAPVAVSDDRKALANLLGAVEDFAACFNVDEAEHTPHLTGSVRTLLGIASSVRTQVS
jgi:hypothetical protein